MGSRSINSLTLGSFSIDNDLIYEVVPGDFGYLSKDDTVSVATSADIGGIRLFGINSEITGPGYYVGNELSKNYPILLSDNNYKAYVHVPWHNNIYHTDGKYLSLITSDYDAASEESPTATISLLVENIYLSSLAGQTNITLSSFEEMNLSIGSPLSDKIETEHVWVVSNYMPSAEITGNLLTLSNYISTEISSLSDNLSTDISCLSINVFNRMNLMSYDISDSLSIMTDTISSLSDYTIKYVNDICSSISNEVSSKYLLINDAKEISTCLSNYTDTKFDNLSIHITSNYALSIDVYGKNLTSCVTDLDNAFNKKQNNLSVYDVINTTGPELSDHNCIASLSAIKDYVNSSISKEAATYRGSYDLSVIKDMISDDFINGTPDNNDYMMVLVDKDNTGRWWENKTLQEGSWRFKYVEPNLESSSPYNCKYWHEEYMLNTSLFTDAQQKALNSGITYDLTLKIESYDEIKPKLEGDYSNLTADFKKLAYQDKLETEDLSSHLNGFEEDLIVKYPNLTSDFGSTVQLSDIQNVVTGTGTAGKIAVFNSAHKIVNNSFDVIQEEWKFELVDGTSVTKKVLLAK